MAKVTALGTIRVGIDMGPTAEAEWKSIGLTPGVLALWEMSGPAREDGSRHSVADLESSETIRLADLGWLVWTSLGQPDTFEAWLPKFLNLDMESEDEEPEPDPTGR